MRDNLRAAVREAPPPLSRVSAEGDNGTCYVDHVSLGPFKTI